MDKGIKELVSEVQVLRRMGMIGDLEDPDIPCVIKACVKDDEAFRWVITLKILMALPLIIALATMIKKINVKRRKGAKSKIHEIEEPTITRLKCNEPYTIIKRAVIAMITITDIAFLSIPTGIYKKIFC